MFLFQFHMIGPVDDTARFKSVDITPSFEYDYILRGKMSWSKNVRVERDATAQIIFSGNDPKFCTHLALAIFLEHSLMNGTIPEEMTDKDLLFNVSKFTAAQHFRNVVSAAGFPLVNEDPVGTHSVCKFADLGALIMGATEMNVTIEVGGRGKEGQWINILMCICPSLTQR